MNVVYILALVSVLLSAAVPAHAQTAADDSSSRHTFVGVSGTVGVGTLGFAALGNVFGRFDSHIIAIRGCGTSELFRGDLHDYGLLYGYSIATAPDVRVNLMGGVGIMGGSRGGSIFRSAVPIANRFAIPLEAEIVYMPLSFLGLAICGFGDINADELFGGITLGLQLGSLR
jgi:hypothetical protein